MPVGVTIKTRRGTAAEWSAANPTLAAGEPGYETDTGILKYGDGVTAYNTLPARVPTSQKTTRSATIVIAASDSSAKSKAQADYVCDGTNDEVEIQAAIETLPASGGCIQFLEGNYIAQGLPLLPRVHYRGLGAGVTKLSLPSNATSALFLAPILSSLKSGSISNMELDGTNSPTMNGIDFGNASHLGEFYISDCLINKFHHGYHSSLDDRYCHIRSTSIIGCEVGAYIYETHPYMSLCDLRYNTVGLGGSPYDMTCDSSRFNYNTYGVKGVNPGDVETCFFTNCSFYNNTETGIDIGRECVIVGCLIGGPNSKTGVSISGSYSTITGCSFRSDGSVGPMVYFMDGKNCNNVVISSNCFYTPTADVIMAGTGTGERRYISITGNTIKTDKHAISFPNTHPDSPFLYGVISNNTIEFYGNIGTDPLINLPNTGTGGCVVTNNVLFSGVADGCGAGILIDARSSIITGNRIRRTDGIVTTQTDTNTINENNICT